MSATRTPGSYAPESIGKPAPQFDDDVVRRARLIHIRGGYSAREVQEHLHDEGHDVPIDMLRYWLVGITRQTAGWPSGRTIDISAADAQQ